MLGRQWFQPLGISVNAPTQTRVYGLGQLSSTQSENCTLFENLPAKFKQFECFRPGLGHYRGLPVKLCINPTARPRRLKARRVAFARRKVVDEEIDRLVREGVWKGPLETAEWSTPIVPVFKPGRNQPRLCGDYRSTLNLVVEMDEYPMPTVEEAFSNHAGCQMFSKLDLKDAYMQLPVEEETAKALTVCTHRGLFSVNRLPFGICSGPSIFQRRMCDLLAGIDGVIVWLDDILVAGPSAEVHDERLGVVLQRLSDAGLRVHPTKCQIGRKDIQYLGFNLDKDGITPLRSKVAAILDLPRPNDVGELQTFLGKLNYYDKFLQSRATVFEPLYRLIDKGVSWTWEEKQEEAFCKAKEMLSSSKLLVHYDLQKEVVIYCDASPVGVGAVLSHVQEDGTDRPIEFASRSLTKPEKNYSQTDKEALSIIFAVKKWHCYLAGRKFVVVTDHKPLLGLFGCDKPMPQVISPRLERWMLFMACYAYEIKYRPGKVHCNADTLSRLCVPGSTSSEEVQLANLFLMTSVESPHLSADQVAAETAKDAVLQKVLKCVMEGWPKKNGDKEIWSFFQKKDEISTERGCLLWGSRVIIPRILQEAALRHLHAAHMGVVRTKRLARVLMWWPKLSTDIEQMVAVCKACQATRARTPRLPTTPWPEATGPWERIHIDFAGPFHNRHFFVIVDAKTGWTDAKWVPGPTAEAAINSLGTCFQYNGLPMTIVSDNGSAFRSHKFSSFCTARGVRQLFTAPEHPSSNGRAERFVRTIKEMLTRLSGNDWNAKLATVLDALRTTPGQDGLSPNQRLMGRKVHTFYSLVLPKSLTPGCGPPEPVFSTGDPVWFKTHKAKVWSPAVVAKPLGAKMALLDTGNARHADQVRRRVEDTVSRAQAAAPSQMQQPKVLMDLPSAVPRVRFPSAPPLLLTPEPRVRSPSPPLLQEPHFSGSEPPKGAHGKGRGRRSLSEQQPLRRSERLKNPGGEK